MTLAGSDSGNGEDSLDVKDIAECNLQALVTDQKHTERRVRIKGDGRAVSLDSGQEAVPLRA